MARRTSPAPKIQSWTDSNRERQRGGTVAGGGRPEAAVQLEMRGPPVATCQRTVTSSARWKGPHLRRVALWEQQWSGARGAF